MGAWKKPGRDASTEFKVLYDLAFFGHFLHVHAGGRSGKQHVLMRLLAHEGRMTQRDLLREAGISSASLSEVLAKLEAEGLIERHRSPDDARQRDIVLTAAGRTKAEGLVRKRDEFESESLAVLDDTEKVQLNDMLDRVAAHWHAMEEEPRTRQEGGM